MQQRQRQRFTLGVAPQRPTRAASERILAEIEEAESEAASTATELTGTLRLNLPLAFGLREVVPAVAEFATLYPSLSIDVGLSDRVVDLVEEGWDMAVRIGRLGDSSLVARKLAPIRTVLCAAPSYLAEHGMPRKPQDLPTHQCLSYAYPQHSELRSSRAEWILGGPDGPARVPIEGRLQIDNADGLRRASLAGMGLAMLPAIMVAEDIRAGRLVEVLSRHAPPARALKV